MRYLAKINLKDIKVSESGGVKTSWVQIFRLGKWKHPRYGPLQFTTEILEGFVQNFKDNVRKVQLAIDQEHEPEKGAAGWIKDVVNVTDSTGKLTKIQDVTPMALANLAIELVGDERVTEGLLNSLVRSLRN